MVNWIKGVLTLIRKKIRTHVLQFDGRFWSSASHISSRTRFKLVNTRSIRPVQLVDVFLVSRFPRLLSICNRCFPVYHWVYTALGHKWRPPTIGLLYKEVGLTRYPIQHLWQKAALKHLPAPLIFTHYMLIDRWIHRSSLLTNATSMESAIVQVPILGFKSMAATQDIFRTL